jgi:DNA polymerase I-like protein with 3'-5' exonuclease and polymerase domains
MENIIFINSQSSLEEHMNTILAYKYLGLDIETHSLEPTEDSIICIQLGDTNQAFVIDARTTNLEPLLRNLEQANPLIIGHNLKFDLKHLAYKYHYEPKRVFDTMLAYGIYNNGRAKQPYVSLKDLVYEYEGVELEKDTRDTFKYTFGDLTWNQIEYAASDVEYLIPLALKLNKQLATDGLNEVAKLEFELLNVVSDMELTGFAMDPVKWLETTELEIDLAAELAGKIATFTGETIVQSSFFGEPKYAINPNSNQQMLELFHSIGIDIPNTRAETLKHVNHKLARLLLDYREHSKRVSTYGKTFLEKHLQEDGRIHPEYNQLGAQSGRYSCSKPNLQNIPSDKQYRSCFVAAPENYIITADFSQIELRVAAVLSGEPAMIEEYQKKDSDLHVLTARRVYHVDEVTPFQRSRGKTCNFGIMYGISPKGFSIRFEVPIRESEQLVAGFWKAYPVLQKYMEEQGNLTLNQGYNSSILGRRRYFPSPNMRSEKYRSEIFAIKREGANMTIQGTAAEIMKRSMVNMYYALKPYNAHMVNTVHDEVCIECPKEFISECSAITYNCMVDTEKEMCGDGILWDASLGFGPTWKKV